MQQIYHHKQSSDYRQFPCAWLFSTAFLGLIAILLMLFHDPVDRWDTAGGYSHGWLILGLIRWMLWEQRSTCSVLSAAGASRS